MKPLDHSVNSVRRYKGKIEDYQDIHEWLDQTKAAHGDMRHRAILHNTMGPFIATDVFGRSIVNSDGQTCDVRQICEDHILEDLGRIPSLSDFLNLIPISEIGKFSYRKGRRVVPGLDD